MHHLAPLIYDLAIMLGLAAVVVLLFQRIRQPIVLGYLVVGIIIGPYTPPYEFVSDIPNIQILSQLGVIFLMFSLGLEFSFQKLTRVGLSAAVTGVVEVMFMIVIGYAVGRLLGWPHYESVFLGAALSISSTTIIIKAIDELGLKSKHFSELIFGVLIVEDLLAILLLVGLSTLVESNTVFSYDMMSAIIKLFVVVGGWFLFGYFLLPPLFRRVSDFISEETLTIVSVALCLSLVCVAASFGYSTALGAFIMGSILAETILIRRIEHLIAPIRDIFAAVFFISVGMLIDPRVIVNQWGIVLLITLTTIFGKLITTSVSAFMTGQSINTSIRSGFSMAQVGEFSFIIAALGLSLNVTSNQLYPIIVAVSAVTTFTTPYLIRSSRIVSETLENSLPDRLLYMLKKYSAWVYRAQHSGSNHRLFYRKLMRLILNGIMVAIIMGFLDSVVFEQIPYLAEDTWHANTASLVIALIAASPFLWGMLFSFKESRIAMMLVWVLTFLEVLLLGIVYFNSWLTLVIFLLVAGIFFMFLYKELQHSYEWFEEHLLKNVNTETNTDNPNELIPWETHMVEVVLDDTSPLVGQTLRECRLRQKYGVNIVGIARRFHFISLPSVNEILMAHDKLIIIGNDDQIDRFKSVAEHKQKHFAPINYIDHFKQKAFLLDEHHELTGKSIREIKKNHLIHGIIVGLERDQIQMINPGPDVILQPDDMVLVVGEINRINF